MMMKWIAIVEIGLILVVSVCISVMMMRKTRRDRDEKAFRDGYSEVILDILATSGENRAVAMERLQAYPHSHTPFAGQVMIDFMKCITGSEYELLSDSFKEQGHLAYTHRLVRSKSEADRLRAANWLMTVNGHENRTSFEKLANDESRLVRIASYIGIAKHSSENLILDLLLLRSQDLYDKQDATIHILTLYGKRFGVERLIALVRQEEMPAAIRKAGIMATAEMRSIEHLDQLLDVIKNSGVMSPQDAKMALARLKSLIEVAVEAA